MCYALLAPSQEYIETLDLETCHEILKKTSEISNASTWDVLLSYRFQTNYGW